MGKFKTQVVTSLEAVPAGWVSLAELAAKSDGSRDSGLHTILCKAHREGDVEAVKHFRSASDWKTGPVFFEPVGVAKFIAEWRSDREPKPQQRLLEIPRATPDTTAETMDSLRRAIVSLAADVRNLQAAIELRAESEATISS